jgi:SAM-dependent methyltransferase
MMWPVTPDGERWNHNLHYGAQLLTRLPHDAQVVLDAGCGEGTLTRRLAALVPTAVGLDRDQAALDAARVQAGGPHYVRGDLLAPPFADASFDAVVSVAALHHVDAGAALASLAALLRPGGLLAVVGLARGSLPRDLPRELIAAVSTRVLKVKHRGYWEQPAPKVWPPPQTYAEVRQTAEAVLPSAAVRRRILWRYDLTWIRPA